MNLAALLDPFLAAIAQCRNGVLVQRIKDKIFLPLLENNITADDIEEESSKSNEEKNDNRWEDGGKLSKKTQKEILLMIN